MTIKAHILTNLDPIKFSRLTPNGKGIWDGVEFSFGLTPPSNIDVLIYFSDPSWSIRVNLPRERIAFATGEPETVIHYSNAFLNQFACVVVSGTRSLKTKQLKKGVCITWWAGYNFVNPSKSIQFDDLISWEMPNKDHRISIITSKHSWLPMHRQRLAFISQVEQAIPDRIIRYGHGEGLKFLPDKKDGLLPHQYHLALENNTDRGCWTEKIADPLLCWSLPFYIGCPNVEDELPSDAFIRLDPTNPQKAIEKMIYCLEHDQWSKRLSAISEARNLLLYRYNIMSIFARIAQSLINNSGKGKTTVYSMRVLPPDKGHKGSSWLRRKLRLLHLAVDPGSGMRRYRKRPTLQHFSSLN